MRDAHYLDGIARLRPGVPIAQAGAELDAISSRLAAEYPATNQGHRFRAGSLGARIVGDVKEPLFLLGGGVLLVLLIACANVSSLQLARGAAGERDLAIRTALGASRARLIRQLLAESTLVALAGGIAGLLSSWWGVRLLVGLAGSSLPRSSEVGIDPAVLTFAICLSLGAGLASGVAPALFVSRTDSIAALRAGASTGARRHARVRSVLVSVEVALALMLLTGSALLIRSFEAIQAVDPGFRAAGVIVLPLSHAEKSAPDFHAGILRRVSAIPGVRASGAIFSLPLAGRNMSGDITPEGRPPHPGDFVATTQIMAGDYFRTMEIPLLRDSRTTAWISIVGVVGDVRQSSLAEQAQPEAYYPIGQAPTPPVEMTLVARTDLELPAFLRALHGEIGPLDPDQPFAKARTLAETVSTTLRQRRLSMVLLSIFSGCALLLAVLGVYATLAFSVAQRTREIGVRMALGAGAGTVVRQVVREGMRPVLAGAALGVAGTLAIGRVISGLLYGVGARDPATFVVVAAVLLAAALLACWIPALRASRVDPVVALRAE